MFLNTKNMNKNKKSSQFTQRPLPSQEDVSVFEKNVNKEIREVEINDNLEDIYKDKEGKLIDVSNQKFKKKKSLILIIFKKIFIISIILSAIYLAYNYLSNYYYASTGSPDLEIIGPERVVLGQEQSYIIKYSNPSMVALNDLILELSLPNSFIVLNYSQEPDNLLTWNLGRLDSKESKDLVITGYFVNLKDFPNIISASLTYTPANFSSQFNKQTSLNAIVSELGFEPSLDYQSTSLLGQENTITLNFNNIKDFHLDQIILQIEKPNNFIFQEIQSEKLSNNKWLIKDISKDLVLNYTISEKVADHQGLSFSLYYDDLLFWEQSYLVEVLKSDLELVLSVNDSRNQLAANFNERLNYNLKYTNHGEIDINNLVLMVVLDGQVLDLTSIESELDFQIMDNVVIFTKDELSNLETFKAGQSANLSFSVKTKQFSSQFIGEQMKINNFAQYSLAGSSSQLEDNKSNEIEIMINSDLSLQEELRYFDENNMPVGSGPLPPKVGEETKLRLYWTLKNNVHDLSDVSVRLNLPEFVEFDNFWQATFGDIYYDSNLHQVIWTIEEMPISIFRADAFFNIKFTPSLQDLDKILVLSPGSIVSASDTVSGGQISIKKNAKTSKLEDDEIASLNNHGRVIE